VEAALRLELIERNSAGIVHKALGDRLQQAIKDKEKGDAGSEATRSAEPAVPVEPAGIQSLHAQGESGKALGLSLRRAMVKYLGKWMDQLRWQRLPSFQKLATMLIKHLAGILNYCRTKVRFGVVEAVNGNIRMLINRGRGYQNLRYLLLKTKRMAVTNTEFIAVHTVKKAA
jgi:transposase